MVTALPGWSLAQSAPRPGPRRIALLLGPLKAPDPVGPAKKAWGELFAKRGFVDGRDIDISIVRPPHLDYLGEGAPEWEATARKVVASRPDMIVSAGPWLLFVRPLTDSIPIVFFGGFNDPAQFGELGIDALRRPGRNVTGVDIFPVEMLGKTLEMLKELRPDARRHGVVGLADRRLGDRLRPMAHGLGLEAVLLSVPIDPPAEAVADVLRAARIDTASFLWNSGDRALHDALEKLRVASSFPGHGSVKAGGLLSYQPEVDVGASVVSMAARILRGEPVFSIPVEQPREFRLAINLRTARALGITVPAAMLLRAQEVIGAP